MTPQRHAKRDAVIREGGAIIHEILKVVAIWLQAQFAIWLSATILYFVGFAIAHTPLWPVLAILCGISSAIPHFGPPLGLLLVLLFSFVGSGGQASGIAAALGVWVLVQVIEGLVIAPRLLGRGLGLNPWIVMLGGIAGALIAGPIGILIATPVLGIVAVIWRRARRSNSGKDTVKH